MKIRSAVASTDATDCAAIYSPYVTDSVVTFELVVPKADDMARRIDQAIEWLVAVEEDGTVVGYAYAGPHAERAAYRWSCDVSIYLAPRAQGRGLGRSLYAELLRRVTARGYRSACACVTLPNPASVALHTALGFGPVGTFTDIGWKDGSWQDVMWFQLALGKPGPPEHEPQ